MNAAFGLRKAPRLRILAVKAVIAYIHPHAVVFFGLKPLGTAPFDTVVKAVDDCSGRIDAMNEPGIQVGCVKVQGRGVVNDIADTRPAVVRQRREY